LRRTAKSSRPSGRRRSTGMQRRVIRASGKAGQGQWESAHKHQSAVL